MLGTLRGLFPNPVCSSSTSPNTYGSFIRMEGVTVGVDVTLWHSPRVPGHNGLTTGVLKPPYWWELALSWQNVIFMAAGVEITQYHVMHRKRENAK